MKYYLNKQISKRIDYCGISCHLTGNPMRRLLDAVIAGEEDDVQKA